MAKRRSTSRGIIYTGNHSFDQAQQNIQEQIDSIRVDSLGTKKTLDLPGTGAGVDIGRNEGYLVLRHSVAAKVYDVSDTKIDADVPVTVTILLF